MHLERKIISGFSEGSGLRGHERGLFRDIKKGGETSKGTGSGKGATWRQSLCRGEGLRRQEKKRKMAKEGGDFSGPVISRGKKEGKGF